MKRYCMLHLPVTCSGFTRLNFQLTRNDFAVILKIDFFRLHATIRTPSVALLKAAIIILGQCHQQCICAVDGVVTLAHNLLTRIANREKTGFIHTGTHTFGVKKNWLSHGFTTQGTELSGVG